MVYRAYNFAYTRPASGAQILDSRDAVGLVCFSKFGEKRSGDAFVMQEELL